jgi:hypothetical protein
MFCPKCGKEQVYYAAFCSECGTPLGAAKPAVPADGKAPAQTSGIPAAGETPNARAGKANPEKKKRNGLTAVLGASAGVIVLAVVCAILFVPRLSGKLPFASGPAAGSVPAISITGNEDGSGIAAGEPVVAAEASLSEKGGTITIKQEGNPADGLKIEVPAGSYTDMVQFTVSTSEIKTHGYNQNLKLISPIIHVENGGAYSECLMKVTIPCTVPKDSIPLAFYYKPDSADLEFIPVLDYGSNFVTYGVRHFSDTLVGVLDNAFLGEKPYIDTGFTPGTDDFSFVNYGSALAPGGQCAGQSLAAIWYYDHLKQKNGSLFGLHDNFGKKPEIPFKTPKFQEDDVLAYRLASVAQAEISRPTFKSRAFLQFADALRIKNETTFNELAALMKFTGSPQLLVIYRINAAKQITSCHAIIAYKIDGNKIYVADPNKPGQKDRYIEISGGRFKGYSSADNAQALEAGRAVNYNLISLLGKSAMTNYDSLKTMWEELDKRTVGDAYFPAVNVKYATKIQTPDGEKEVDVKDGYAATVKDLKLILKDTGSMYYTLYLADKNGKIARISHPANPPPDFTYTFPLQKGENYIGISLYKSVDGEAAWYDFQWMTVKFEVPTLDELVGTYDDGSIKLTEVFISERLREEAKAKAAAEAAEDEGKTGLDQIDAVGNGCDLKIIEQLDKMKGQSYPRKFVIKKTAENKGTLTIIDEDGGETPLPFTYKDGVLNVEYNIAASAETANQAFTVTGPLNAAYGKENSVVVEGTVTAFAGSREDFYMDEHITGSKPLPPKTP